MSIQDLPDELLLHIFKPFADIQKHDDPSECTETASEEVKSNLKSLASFSKVCVKWHKVVEPILYSTFRKPASTTTEGFIFPPILSNNPRQTLARLWTPIRNDNHLTTQRPSFLRNRDGHTRVAWPNLTLRLFLRTIIEQPHLAVSIKKIVLGSWLESVNLRHEPGRYMIEPSQPEPSLRQTYFKALRRLVALRCSRSSTVIFLWREFVSQVLDGYEGSELVLLLQSTPNLTTLHLAQIPVIEEWMGIGENGLARHVSTIRLGSNDRRQEVRIFRLRTLMTLPSLRRLTFVNCSVQGYCVCPRPKLTHLGFQRCHITHGTFDFLMEYISNLESFEWIGLFLQQHDLDRRWIVHHDLLTRNILAFVRRQGTTLRSLRLLGDGFGFRATAQASFKSLNLLEKLTIQGRLLHEASNSLSDQLPRSLKYLEIGQCCFHMMRKLVALINARALPKLEKIEYTYTFWDALPYQPRMYYELVVAELEKLCATEGIAFVKLCR